MGRGVLIGQSACRLLAFAREAIDSTRACEELAVVCTWLLQTNNQNEEPVKWNKIGNLGVTHASLTIQIRQKAGVEGVQIRCPRVTYAELAPIILP